MGMLIGKTALITGGGGGIGGAIAQLFVREGARVCLVDRRADALAEQVAACEAISAGAATACLGDVTSEAGIGEIFAAYLSRHDVLDILVNSSGAISEVALANMSLADWNGVMDGNLTSVFLASRAALPIMRRGGSGRIINIASQIGQRGAPRFTHYAASKAGVIGFTKALAREVAREGILVNAIAPGPVLTTFNASLSPATLAGTEDLLPLGRPAMPEEVAPTALLLAASPSGDVYVGQTLGPNSGDVML